MLRALGAHCHLRTSKLQHNSLLDKSRSKRLRTHQRYICWRWRVGRGPADRKACSGRVQWLTGRSSKFGQTFGLFQGSLQHDRQYRLSNKVDWFIGQKCRPCWFIQVRAEKYAPQRLLRVELPGRIDAAAALRKANIHQNHIGIVRGR